MIYIYIYLFFQTEHVQSHSSRLLFCGVLVAVAVVVCLSSLVIAFDVERKPNLLLCPVSFELVCLCTAMRNESSRNERVDVRAPNWPHARELVRSYHDSFNESSPLSSCVLACDRFLWEPARRLRRWTVHVLKFQGSLSLLNSPFKYNVI